MPGISEYLTGNAFPPGSVGSRLQSLGGFFDEIATVEFPDMNAATSVLNEQVRHLRHTLEMINRQVPQNLPLQPATIIAIEVYWARESDLVLWTHPQSVWYDQAILFCAYSEFVRWTQWRLRASLGCTLDELTRIGLELGNLRSQRRKITFLPA